MYYFFFKKFPKLPSALGKIITNHLNLGLLSNFALPHSKPLLLIYLVKKKLEWL